MSKSSTHSVVRLMYRDCPVCDNEKKNHLLYLFPSTLLEHDELWLVATNIHVLCGNELFNHKIFSGDVLAYNSCRYLGLQPEPLCLIEDVPNRVLVLSPEFFYPLGIIDDFPHEQFFYWNQFIDSVVGQKKLYEDHPF